MAVLRRFSNLHIDLGIGAYLPLVPCEREYPIGLLFVSRFEV